MFKKFFSLFTGGQHKKFLKECRPIVEKINKFEESYRTLSDEALKAKTEEFKQRLKDGETLDDLLPEAFAVVKNAARRLCGGKIIVCEHELEWNMIHYDVQLIGGIALHRDTIAEMATGEGKTLVATLPLYLNALTGKNCQLVTVNDYLAKRDSEWMGHLYKFLGITVGCIQNGMDSDERREAYGCDITFGTSSEFGFDYLRDNGMASSLEEQVQRGHYFCIVDEVDSILIDEARTPLIISGPVAEVSEAPFMAIKPGVQALVHRQTLLCNRLAQEAKEELEADEKSEEALRKLLQVKTGMPKSKVLLRMMENGSWRKRFEAYELELQGEFNRDKLLEIKEELYFVIDEKQHQADLTEQGRNALRPDDKDAFMLPDLPTMFSDLDKRKDISPEEVVKRKQAAEAEFARRSEDIHCLSQLLRAYCIYEKDVEYVVQEGKVVIIDQNTGRAMPGRRWSEGLHQAVEAKEGVKIEKESKTYATITIQNYFRMYEKLAGMTGTAETESQEFYDIYRLKVLPIPTNKPCVRKDLNDTIYKTRREKYNAVVNEIEKAHKRGQPVLVGTTSVENSEVISRFLKRAGIPHNVLNAKFHQREAEIVALAGQRGAVTIATNMAGRGTDIKLGEGVGELGGLYVIATERHESRRIDLQLRGRCARQGDPGLSKFNVSLEDDLMRLFANAGPISAILQKTFKEGEELEHPLLNRSIQSAQKKVEQQNFAIRKRLLQYDDVLNKQREVVYGLRNEVLHSPDPKEIIFEMVSEEMDIRVEEARGDYESFIHWANLNFPVSIKSEDLNDLSSEGVRSIALELVKKAYEEKEAIEDASHLKSLERFTLISSIDRNWQDHLTEMEELRRSVGLRSYGQKDPLSEYKSEAFTYFEEMLQGVRSGICLNLFRSATSAEKFEQMVRRLAANAKVSGPSDSAPKEVKERELPKISIVREAPKVGRNDPCPCGSGKKYKKCCGVGVE